VIAGQDAAIAELKADVVALAAEVRDLRRWLGRNSGNRWRSLTWMATPRPTTFRLRVMSA